MTRPKAIGTAAESALVPVFQPHWPSVERRALAGSQDKGDLLLPFVAEVKAAKTYRFNDWLKELDQEKVNARSEHGILIVKLNGVGYANADQWLTCMRVRDAIPLLKAAGL